jgi:environmental stress-induced protein Ves
MRLLRPSDYLDMPWKDGGGVTTQIVIHPEAATLASGFEWRLSMAKVGAGGPFSRFDGYDRHLVLLDGPGMVLRFGENLHRMDQPLVPFSFPGDMEITATLLDGPCKDFNLIVRRSQWRSELKVIEATPCPRPLPSAFVRALHALAPLRINDLAMNAGDTLILEAGEDPALCAASHSRSAALLALLHPLS